MQNLPVFDSCPDLIDVQVTDDAVEEVAKHLSGSAGPSGIDSSSLSQWLLKHGGASSNLRKTMAKLVEWLANSCPPWAAYRALTWGRLIGLDKCPGVRPVGIGDMFRRFLCKVLLKITGKEATRACKTDQLCGGLEAGMEGAMHHMRSLWDTHENDENDWGVLLIDARNAFNEGNRKMMACIVRHEWPSGSRFLFNMHRHHSVLVMRGETASKTVILHSKEGVTQGCPLSMVGYAILMLPMMQLLKIRILKLPQCGMLTMEMSQVIFQQ